MAEKAAAIESIAWRRLFPWLHLSRSFWIAIDPRKLALAAAGLLLISAGNLAINRLPFASPEMTSATNWPWNESVGYAIFPSSSAASDARLALSRPVETISQIAGNWQLVLLPVGAVCAPAAALFQPDLSVNALADAALRLLWAIVVWAIFGGAIGRIAAVQFARDQQVGIRAALKFALSRFFGYVAAPVLPLVGVGSLWGLCVVGGWLGRIPGGVGDFVLGALWGLELIFGLMMAVILVGLAVGWPLMFATIAVEGTDGFDGLSRMYNYVFERPLYFLWQLVVMLVYGSVVIFFVWMMSRWLVHMAIWGVAWGLGYSETVRLTGGAPELIAANAYSQIPDAASLGGELVRAWMCTLATLVLGFVYSYFWTAATISYCLLRHSVDGNELEEVYAEQDHEPDDLLPLVGTAVSELADSNAGQPVVAGASEGPPPVDLAP
ncbi:MAG: hypothetical protein ACT4QC_02260 [Planctomycetaceae bacterium]